MVVRNGAVDIAIEDGRIAAIGPDLPSRGEEIDAIGLTILPGLIDVHVHFNEPGRTEWEGASTGSRALAAGGGTMFFDMPLNSAPCTVDGAAFDEKRSLLEQSSITDFALWGGLIPGNLDSLPVLADKGVIGFKAFMADSGLPEFPRCDDTTLLAGMRKAAELGLPIAVHAESQELIRNRTQSDASSIREFLSSRSVEAEIEAIRRAATMAGETGVKLHIVHISSGAGVTAALQARARGVDISLETCPHYLFFTEDDLLRIGALLKCTPPLRTNNERKALWEALVRGDIDIVGSDHSPAPPAMKSHSNFFSVWGGIAGIQSTLQVLLENRDLSLERIGMVTSINPARRFGIPNKGGMEVGKDADLVFVDRSAEQILEAQDLFQRHAASPYVGSRFRSRIVRTMLRGQTIFLDGRITAERGGRFIRPYAESRANA